MFKSFKNCEELDDWHEALKDITDGNQFSYVLGMMLILLFKCVFGVFCKIRSLFTKSTFTVKFPK